jgi:hypothetical protein
MAFSWETNFELHAELDRQPAGNDESQAEPGSSRRVLPEDEASAE